MNGLGRILRFGFFFALMHSASMPVSAAEDAAVERGKAWLAAQVQADGSLRQEATSIATALQARSETLQTQAQLAGAAPVLIEAVRSDAATTTEFVARRAISLAAAGAQTDGLATALRRNLVAASGFGAEQGHPANPLDTSFALIGLRATGATRDSAIAQALGYLTGAAAADGGYGEGQRPYATSYALLALQRWRADYDLSAAVTRTRAALVAQQASGVYADTMENAVAAIALQASGPVGDAAGAVAALRATQAADGSWSQDPYLTALALRALAGGVDAPAEGSAVVAGQVIDSVSKLPLSGASITLAASTLATTGSDGRFQATGLASGTATIRIARNGYQSVERSVALSAGITHDMGNVALAPLAGSAILRGVVTDTRQHQPQAGVTVALSGVVNTQTVTNAEGYYEFVGLPAGTVTVTTSKAGFTGNSESLQLIARDTLWYSTWVCPTGETPPNGSTATLQGRVVDAADQSPVAGALVVMGARTVSTGADGAFAFGSGPAGPFAAEIRADGYLTVSLSGSLAAGVNDAGVIAMVAGQSNGTPTSSTLVGRVTQQQGGEAIVGARVLVDGTERARTDAEGNYRIIGIDALSIALSFRAVGFESEELSVQMPAFGVYRVDRALATAVDEASAFQVLGVSMRPTQTAPGETFTLEAQIAHLGDGLRNALVLPRVVDGEGLVVSTLCGTATPCEQGFGAHSTLAWSLAGTMANLPAGPYTLKLQVVEPGTIAAGNPTGLVLAEGELGFTVAAKPRLGGSVQGDPPALIPQSTAGVTLGAMLRNLGNAAVPAGEVRLEVLKRGTTTVVHSALAAHAELLPSDLREIEFGAWHPSAAAEYDLVVTSTNPGVGGRLTGTLYVGDAAKATFTVTPQETSDGDQTVQGQIAVTGIDNPSGQAADPLFLEVRQAVTDGARYTGEEAKAWQRATSCNGCHTQAQSLYGLASSIGKADIDLDNARFMYNSLASAVEPPGRVDVSHNSLYKAQSSLALWSMGAWPDRRASFTSRYRIAEFMYGQRNISGDRMSWSTDYNVGWLSSEASITSIMVEGNARVLEDNAELGLDTQRIATQQVRLPGSANQGGGRIAAGPDGMLYEIIGGSVRSIHPDTGVATTIATPGGIGGLIALAVDGQRNIYLATSGPALYRLSPAGAVSEVTRAVPYPVDIDMMPNGDVALLGTNRQLVAVTPAGAVRTVYRDGVLPHNPNNVTAFRDGTLYVAANGTHGLARIAADGTARRIDQGLHFRPIDVAEMPDGGMLMTVESYGEPRHLVLFTPDGVAERLKGTVNTAYVELIGERIFTLDNDLAVRETVISEVSAARLGDIRNSMTGTTRFFLSRLSDQPSNTELAFQLIGLAEARPYVAADLVTAIDTRVAELGQRLRTRQGADGGWGPSAGNTSDPLSSAIVGTALDYLGPASTDPVLRKTVRYLLDTQGTDGSWPPLRRYFGTRHGATSYVIAYLPKAIARLGGIDISMSLSFPSNVRMADPTTAPSSSSALPGGGMQYGFELGRVTSRAFNLRFNLNLDDLQAGEQRAAASAASLRFRNSFNGELIEIPIAIPAVRARNGWALDLALNRTTFQANEQVDVLPTVRNLSSLYGNGSLRYFIETAQGELVAELSGKSFDGITAGTQRVVPHAWNTGTTLAGDYRARVQLNGPDGARIAEAQVPFVIQAGTAGQPLLSGHVATDKAEYDPFERVTVLGRARNEAPNLGYTNLTLAERVTAPDGTVVFEGSAPIAQLLPSALFDRSFPFALGNAAPGTYAVLQRVLDANGTVLDTRNASFRVRSTAETGVGLSGTITATPATVEQGDSTRLDATALNGGNADIVGVPLTISVVDPAAERVLFTAESTHDLPRGVNVPLQADWSTAGVAPGDYLAVLNARVGGTTRTLATTPVKVVEPPVRADLTLEVSGDNRLLVLVTCRIGNGRAEDEACVAQRVPFLHQLLTDMGIAHHIVTSTEAFRREFRSGRYNTYWISGGAEKLANPLAEEVREAVFRGEALLVDGNHDSRNQILDDALGVRHIGQLAGNVHRLIVAAGGAYPVSDYAVPGDALRFQSIGAQAHAAFDASSGQTGLFGHAFGQGRSALHAYDLVLALQQAGSADQARAVLDRSLRLLLGPARASFLGGEYVEVSARVTNQARESALDLTVATSDAARIEFTAPQAAPQAAHLAQWHFVLAVAQERWFDTGVRLPEAAGPQRIDGLVSHDAGGSVRNLDAASLELTVVSATAATDTLVADLRALVLAAPAERNARDRVVTLIGEARQQWTAGRHDDALGTLLRAIDELAKLESVPTASYRVGIARLMGAIERHWVAPAN